MKLHSNVIVILFLELLDAILSSDIRQRDKEDELSRNNDTTCPIMSITASCDSYLYYIWNSIGSLFDTGITDAGYSDCYDPDECYSIQLLSMNEVCEYGITMDGDAEIKGTIWSNPHGFPDSLIRVGDCAINEDELELHAFSNHADDI